MSSTANISGHVLIYILLYLQSVLAFGQIRQPTLGILEAARRRSGFRNPVLAHVDKLGLIV